LPIWSNISVRSSDTKELALKNPGEVSRREWLAGIATTAALGSFSRPLIGQDPAKPKSVAAILTAYEKGLHADVLIGKILEGWKQDNGPGPALTVASMYVEQFTDRDLARPLSKKYGVPIFDSIEKAVTVGSDRIPVDGVISVGEHGTYPYNEKEQHLYPRRRFFEEITDTFRKYNRVVPVFNDKHLGPVWSDALWMYDRAKEMEVPFMAGSSLTVTYRNPELTIPLNSPIDAAVGIGYSGLDIYGAHALECFQCMVDRRSRTETGVKWVQFLQGPEMWKFVDDGVISDEVFQSALSLVAPKPDQVRQLADASLFLFQYQDGLIGAVFMLPGFATGNAFALKIKGQNRVLATRFEERTEPRHPHFAYLLKGIERMIHTGKPSYPVERTLLTSGILDRALTSKVQKHQKLMTPELAIRYEPADYPHAPEPNLTSDPNGK
jgi:hypothetical protein